MLKIKEMKSVTSIRIDDDENDEIEKKIFH